jgi:taurine dioxygenase
MSGTARITASPEAVRLKGPVGAEIKGVQLDKGLEDVAYALVFQQLNAHTVLLFRDQSVTPKQLTEFAGDLGELVPALPNEYGRISFEGLPIEVISNVVENGKEIGSLGAGEAAWHTDMSMYEQPSSYTVLHALEVPLQGGDTYFADMRAAYATLPDALRTQVEGGQANHAGSYLSGGQLRPGYEPITDVSRAKGARHPIVRTHPLTKRKALYLGRRRAAWIVGLPVPESEALLDELWAHATQPAFVWRHSWRVGDILVWDNRCLIHRRDAFDPSSRRVMLRLTVRGEKPV